MCIESRYLEWKGTEGKKRREQYYILKINLGQEIVPSPSLPFPSKSFHLKVILLVTVARIVIVFC